MEVGRSARKESEDTEDSLLMCNSEKPLMPSLIRGLLVLWVRVAGLPRVEMESPVFESSLSDSPFILFSLFTFFPALLRYN